MPEDVIEMLWKCSTCSHVNKGRHHSCQSCGKPLENEEWFMPEDISHEARVQDERMLEDANAGPDWRCRYCGSSQKRNDGSCAQCGASQGEEVKAARFEPEPTPSRDWAGWARDHAKSLIIGGVFLVAGVLFLALRTHEVDAKVSSVAWRYEVDVERYQKVREEGWLPPFDAIESSPIGLRVHHYDHVRVGSHQESYSVQVQDGQTCTTIPRTCYQTPRTCNSNRNGYASCSGGDQVCSGGGQSCTPKYRSDLRTRTVDDYEDQPRYRMWFMWRVWRWRHNRTAVTEGSTISTRWPSVAELHLNQTVSDGEQERTAGRREKYNVELAWGDKHTSYYPTTLNEFRGFTVGSWHVLSVSLLTVSVVR